MSAPAIAFDHTAELLTKLDGRDVPSKQWIRAHLDYPHRDFCLIWPFSRIQSGYAVFTADSTSVHRFMCEYRNGPPPSPKHHAAHSCGQGHAGCVNPWHLNWRTVSENMLERSLHHGIQPQRKLTAEEVDQIRALEGRARVRDIAAQFGVSDTNIRNILAGRLWKQDTQVHVLTEDQVREIRTMPWRMRKSGPEYASKFGVPIKMIHRVRSGKTYRWVTDQPEDLPKLTSTQFPEVQPEEK